MRWYSGGVQSAVGGLTSIKRPPSRIMSISNSNTSVQPYLFFGGRCEEVLNFYRNAVGAEVQMLTRFKESPEPHGLPDCFDDKITRATVRIGKTTLMASDGQCEGKQDFEGFTSRLRCLTRPRPSVSLLRWVKA